MPATKPPGSLQRGDVICALPGVELLELDGKVFGLSPSGDFFGLDEIDVQGLREVLAQIDGQRTLGEIVDALAPAYDAGDVLALLEALTGTVLQPKPSDENRGDLAARGVVVIGSGELAREVRRELETAGFSDVGSVEPRWDADEGRQIRERSPHVRLQPATAIEVRASVAKQELTTQLAGRSLVVCALEGVSGQALLDVNAACLEAGVPVLFVTVQSQTITVGPLTVPGRSACFACSRLSTILRSHFETEGPALLPFISFTAYPAGAPRWALARAAYEVAREAMSAMRGVPYPNRLGSLLHIDPSGETRTQTVRPVTTCPACRGHHRRAVLGADAPAPGPLVRSETAIVSDRSGGTRSVGPDAAHRRAVGALQRLGVDLVCARLPSSAPDELLALECPYYTVRQQARFSVDAPIVWPAFDDNCFGKGTTDAQALCSVVFEWIERNMAGWHGDLDLVRAPYREVRDRAIDMAYLVAGLLPGVPLGQVRELEESIPIDWVWGHCLKSGKPTLLPAACVFLGPSFFRGSSLELTGRGSSGLSAGCTLGDATLQGLLEVVERDAHYVALRNGLPLPWIDLGSITDSGSRRIIDSMDRSGYEVRLRDITTEIGIPSIEAYVVRDGEYTHHFASGYGAHLDPEIAVRRALSEAGQMLFFDIAKGRDLPERSSSSVFNVFIHRKQAIDQRAERRLLADLPRSIDDRTPVWEQVDLVVSRIASGVPAADVCVVDLSHPRLEGIHVVRTLVSGMLDEARDIQIHVPARCRRVPLSQMYLGRAMQ